MDQVLNIFRKDGRRHWPEILGSLILLGLYARSTAHPWEEPPKFSFLFRLVSMKSAGIPILLLVWAFLVIRVVHGENLVGDEQWWVTKPYVWWKLLAAKLLLIFSVISIPMFFVQCYLIHAAGFSVMQWLGTMIAGNLALFCFLVVPITALAATTRGLGQVLAGVLAVVICVWIISWLETSKGGVFTGPSGSVADSVQPLLLYACFFAALILQFARRRTIWSRALFLAGFVLCALLMGLTPVEWLLHRDYALADNSGTPVKISVGRWNEAANATGRWARNLPEVFLTIPLHVSGVSKDTVVVIEGEKLTFRSPDGKSWSPGWMHSWVNVWQGDERKSLQYNFQRKDAELWKGKQVQIDAELALREIRGSNFRELTLPAGEFRDPRLGLCRLSHIQSSAIECYSPKLLAFIATFDPAAARCELKDEDDEEKPAVPGLAYAWQGVNDFNMALPAVQESYVSFVAAALAPGSLPNGANAHLCAGAKIRLGDVNEVRRFRMQFHLQPAIPFDSLIE